MKDTIGKIEKLSLKKGDVVTIELKVPLRNEEVKHLKVKLQRHFKDNELILLSPGVEIKTRKK